MTDFSGVRRVANAVKPGGDSVHFRTGVIVSYAAGRATVNVGGDTTDIPDVPCLYGAVAADNVLLLADGARMVVLCQLT